MSHLERVDLSPPTRPRLAERVATLPPSGIRQFFDLVIGREDIVSLGVGEPDFVTPWRIREAAIHALNRGETSYTSNAGLASLRRAVADYLGRRFGVSADPETELLITVGASEAIDLALRSVLNPGDEVIYLEPAYVAYEALIRLAGGIPRALPLRAEQGFGVDWAGLESLMSPRTRALVVNYPCNPTGMSLKPEEVVKLARLAAQHEIVLISDEIYAELSYGPAHHCLAAVPEAADWTVLISGFSKAFAMTGWRIGYAAGPAEIIGGMTRIHQYGMLCAPILAQRAAECALAEGFADMAEMVETYRQRRNYFQAGLNEAGLPTLLPDGAFYMFPSIAPTGLDSMTFCRRLLEEEGLAVVPGAAFGPAGEGHIRASYAVGFDRLDLALAALRRFLNRL